MKTQRHLEDSHCRLKMIEYLLTSAYKKIHGIMQSVQLNHIHPLGTFQVRASQILMVAELAFLLLSYLLEFVICFHATE